MCNGKENMKWRNNRMQPRKISIYLFGQEEKSACYVREKKINCGVEGMIKDVNYLRVNNSRS